MNWVIYRMSTLQAVVLKADKDGNFYAWAVRPGEVSAVPEPSAILLLGSGLAGMIAFRRKMSI